MMPFASKKVFLHAIMPKYSISPFKYDRYPLAALNPR